MIVHPSALSIVIPTYRREEVLMDTVRYLMELPDPPPEILVVDQTEKHTPPVESFFQGLEKKDPDIGKPVVRRIVLPEPSIPHAMNVGLQEAAGEVVLFLDDDIIPDAKLVSAHVEAHAAFPEAAAVVGQVLQPEDRRGNDENRKSEILKKGERRAENRKSETLKKRDVENKVSAFQPFRISGFISPVFQRFSVSAFQHSPLRRDLDFPFNSSSPAWIENVMAGNLSVKKERAIAIDGFDENFIPPVSFRFETEFAKRLVASGGRIRFEPAASIRHLRAGQGGTRSRGSHLTSASPLHGVGDYYYALRRGQGTDRVVYMIKRPFREVSTRFHLTHPWYIPIKFVGELRAIALAFKLSRNRSGFLPQTGDI